MTGPTLKTLAEQALQRADAAETKIRDLIEQLDRTEKPLHVYLHQEASPSVSDRLDLILTRLEHLDMATVELKAALAKIDTATDNIAADIVRLKAKIGTGMSDADVAEVQAEADKLVKKLEGLAADPDNPDPVV